MRFSSLRFPLAVLLVAVGCRAAPPPEDFDVPDNPLGSQGSAYASFDRHIELLEPLLLQLIEQGQSYVGEDRTDCYRLPNLTACDMAGFCAGLDPSEVISLTHAATLTGPTTSFRDAMLHEDMTEVYPGTYLAYAIDDPGEPEPFLAGEKQLHTWTATARLSVLVAEVDYYVINTMREVPNWAGGEHSLFLIRGYMPTPGQSNTDNVSMDHFYSLDMLVPVDDGANTLRVQSSWNGLRIGDITVENTFSLGCNDVRAAFSDLQNYVASEGS